MLDASIRMYVLASPTTSWGRSHPCHYTTLLEVGVSIWFAGWPVIRRSTTRYVAGAHRCNMRPGPRTRHRTKGMARSVSEDDWCNGCLWRQLRRLDIFSRHFQQHPRQLALNAGMLRVFGHRHTQPQGTHAGKGHTKEGLRKGTM